MHIISKQGSADNVLTYEHICDTAADMAAIERRYITLGSVCIVLQGESGAMEVYMADSDKEWHDVIVTGGSGSGSGESAPAGLSLYICTSSEVANGKPDVDAPAEGVLYLVPSGNESGNLYNEYIYVNDAWELFCGASIDLTGYATQAWVSQQGYLTSHQDISGKADRNEIPTKVSDLQNDSGFITGYTETDPTVPAWAKASTKPTYTASEVGAVSDVQVNGTSIVTNGVASIPAATESIMGAVRAYYDRGIDIENGRLQIAPAGPYTIKDGEDTYLPVTSARVDAAAFFGLAKAAGDSTQAAAPNQIGNYTNGAKSAIQAMLGITTALAAKEDKTQVVNVSDTDPVITAAANTQYICGEVSTLSFTPSATGTCDIIFESGSTATVLTLPSTVKLPEWFDASDLEADTVYEISILNGVYGAVMAW